MISVDVFQQSVKLSNFRNGTCTFVFVLVCEIQFCLDFVCVTYVFM